MKSLFYTPVIADGCPEAVKPVLYPIAEYVAEYLSALGCRKGFDTIKPTLFYDNTDRNTKDSWSESKRTCPFVVYGTDGAPIIRAYITQRGNIVSSIVGENGDLRYSADRNCAYDFDGTTDAKQQAYYASLVLAKSLDDKGIVNPALVHFVLPEEIQDDV